MPILGLFPSNREDRYAREVSDLASGRRSSIAVNELRSNADLARKQAFSQAMQSRGNPALAQRQAMDVGRDITMQSGQQIAQQRQADFNAARAEQQRLEQQRLQGINNLVGFGVRGAQMLAGGPAVKAAAGAAVDAAKGTLGGSQPFAPKPPIAQNPAMAASPAQGAGMGPLVSNEDIMSLAGPRQPAAPMRQDLQQYLDPNVILESGSRLSNDVSGLQNIGSQLTNEYLLQGLPVNPQFMRGVRRAATR